MMTNTDSTDQVCTLEEMQEFFDANPEMMERLAQWDAEPPRVSPYPFEVQ